jgi:hypothetical protein
MRAVFMAYLQEVGTLAYTAWTATGPEAQEAFWALMGHALWWVVIYLLWKKVIRPLFK